MREANTALRANVLVKKEATRPPPQGAFLETPGPV
jgi:hypothetical protein